MYSQPEVVRFIATLSRAWYSLVIQARTVSSSISVRWPTASANPRNAGAAPRRISFAPPAAFPKLLSSIAGLPDVSHAHAWCAQLLFPVPRLRAADWPARRSRPEACAVAPTIDCPVPPPACSSTANYQWRSSPRRQPQPPDGGPVPRVGSGGGAGGGGGG